MSRALNPSYAMPPATSLPADRTGWELVTDRSVLLVLNLQVHFLRVLERHGAPAGDLLSSVALLIRAARDADVPVIHVAQAQALRGATRTPLPYGTRSGAQPGPGEWRAVAQARPQRGDIVLRTRKHSAFARTRLDGHLYELERDQVVITGLFARVGVLTTAADAWTYNLEPFVVGDAVADLSDAHHMMALSWVSDTSGAVTAAERVAAVFDGTLPPGTS
ncbi:isochorismatase family protein [Streptomyces sp. TS71-3]|uniref:isochorismatase family protein n=1 Tax=Streptomyces sp. TS71-3 TaxID=2733862 RepID=UPI001B04520E|nr:isochorismatase family protein [Streptomyces sp. TS71-3]GHJ41208.1 hypothetical protein Sm713_68170 [Streptomyces sp. TS71-3]